MRYRDRVQQLEGELTKLTSENRILQDKLAKKERERDNVERGDEGDRQKSMDALFESERRAHNEQLDSLFLEKRQLTQNIGMLTIILILGTLANIYYR